MKHATHHRKIRQFDRLIAAMKQAMRDRQPKAVVERLRLKIAAVLRDLKGILNKGQLATKLGALAVLFGLSTASYAQTFSAPVANPFGFQADSTSYAGGICTADIDNDGDLDLFMGGYYGSIDFIENTGDVNNPAFGNKTNNPFGLTSTYYYAFLTAIDLDDDGDYDILAGEYYGELEYFENTGTATSPTFAAPVTDPFGLSGSNLFDMPEFVDLDDDGDYDVLVGQAYGAFQYFENTGTAAAPAFAAPVLNPFGLTAAYSFAYPTAADLDLDGDLDLLVGAYYGSMYYYENTGTATVPAFAAPVINPFGLTAASNVLLPEMVDIDGDGDYDVLGSGYYGSLIFFENTEFNLGVDENTLDLTLAPNPVQDILSWSSEISVNSLEVYSLSGNRLIVEENPAGSVNVTSLAAGMYVVRVTDASGRSARIKFEKL